MRTSRIVALSCAALAVLGASSLEARGQQSVANGFTPDILSAPFTLPGTTDLTYGWLDSGDVNEDGLPDVVVFDTVKFDGGPYWVDVYLGTPSGDLSSAPLQLPVPVLGLAQLPRARVADVNADGHLDVMAVYRFSGSVGVFLGNGNGGFGPLILTVSSSGGSPGYFDVGDVDDDGFPDLVLADNDFFTTYRILWVRGHGDGTFDAPVKLLGARYPGWIVVRDFDADGVNDLAFVDTKGVQDVVVVVHRGTGGGSFAEGVAYSVGPTSYAALATADANGDGRLDLYSTTGTVGAGSTGVHILLGVGDGSFIPGPVVNFGVSVPASFAVTDIDRDGVPDLIGSGSFDYELQRMGHSGAIGPMLKLNAGGQITAMHVTDLDVDGLPDLVAIKNKSAVRVLNLLEGFIDVGYGQSSELGTPVLTVSGTPQAGQPIMAGVALGSRLPALLVIGASSDLAPFHGGVLVPEPDVLLPIMTGSSFPSLWPSTIVPGTAIHIQAVLASGGGETLNSNALVMIAE